MKASQFMSFLVILGIYIARLTLIARCHITNAVFDDILSHSSKVKCLHKHRISHCNWCCDLINTGVRNVNIHGCWLKNIKLFFEVTINIQSGAKWPSLRMQYIQACLLTKQNFFWCFDVGLEQMAARSLGNGTNFD